MSFAIASPSQQLSKQSYVPKCYSNARRSWHEINTIDTFATKFGEVVETYQTSDQVRVCVGAWVHDIVRLCVRDCASAGWRVGAKATGFEGIQPGSRVQ